MVVLHRLRQNTRSRTRRSYVNTVSGVRTELAPSTRRLVERSGKELSAPANAVKAVCAQGTMFETHRTFARISRKPPCAFDRAGSRTARRARRFRRFPAREIPSGTD